MEITKHVNVIIIGFFVWMALAPRLNSRDWGARFLAYMVTLLVCLMGTSEIMMTAPNAFFFTVGGSLAFLYMVIKLLLLIQVEKKQG